MRSGGRSSAPSAGDTPKEHVIQAIAPRRRAARSTKPSQIEAKVIRLSEVPSFSFVEGIDAQELFNHPETCSAATVRLEPGATNAVHLLRGVLELQLVQSGEGRWRLGDDPPVRAKAGDLVVIPKGVKQSTTNIGRTPLIFTCFCVPRFDPRSEYVHLEDPKFDLPRAEVGVDGVVAIVPAFDGRKSDECLGKVAVVTGGNRGLGLETARQLGKRGFKVVLTARNGKSGKAATAQLQREGVDVSFHALDVTREESARELSSWLSREPGIEDRVDVLVNNAGICLDRPGQSTDPEHALRDSLETNCFGALRVTRHLLPFLEAADGRVINVSSELATSTWEGEGFDAYRASKAALHAETRRLAKTSASVSYNCVDPGSVKTDMGGQDAPDTTTDGVQAALWIATTQEPPTGGMFRRAKDLAVPPNHVAIERRAW